MFKARQEFTPKSKKKSLDSYIKYGDNQDYSRYELREKRNKGKTQDPSMQFNAKTKKFLDEGTGKGSGRWTQ